MFSKWHKFRIFWKWLNNFSLLNLFFKECLFALWSRSSKLHWNAICQAWSQNSSCKYGEKRTYSGASFIYPKNGHFIKAEKHENIGRYWNSLSFFIGYSKAYHYLLHIYMKVLWSKFFTTNSSSCSYLLRIYSNHILISWNK